MSETLLTATGVEVTYGGRRTLSGYHVDGVKV